MRGELAIRTAALFEFESTSADSEPTKVVVHFEDPVVRSAWSRGLSAPRARDRAWEANPHCVECNKRIPRTRDAGLLPTDEGPRVACKRPCFIRAVARINPTLSTGATVRRAGRSFNS